MLTLKVWTRHHWSNLWQRHLLHAVLPGERTVTLCGLTLDYEHDEPSLRTADCFLGPCDLADRCIDCETEVASGRGVIKS